MHKVFIHGGSGTTGLRLKERLLARDDVSLVEIGEAERKDPEAVKTCMASAEFTFFCLPDEAALEATPLAAEAGCRVIDCSFAHRTDPAWTYGYPELSPARRAAVAASERVAGPGCHAGGCICLMYPLLKSGLVPEDYPFCFTSVTGYSGGGKKMIAEYEDADRPASFSAPRQYALGQTHKHMREAKAVCGLQTEPVFLPIVDDFYAGMHVTLPLQPRCIPGRPTLKNVLEVLQSHYADSKLIHVLPEPVNDGMLSASALAGRDDLCICVSGNDERVLLHALFDNLGKGASGAAIQCFNIMAGLPEETGLVIGKAEVQ